MFGDDYDLMLMSSGRMPTTSEVLDVMDRLEHDAERRIELSRSYDIFRACVDEGIVCEDSIDWIAQRMQQLLGEGLIAHGMVNGGVHEPPVWDGQWIQMMHDWRVTATGRADAALYRSESRALSAPPHTLDSIMAFDLFICHAGEDKGAVARPLSDAITQRGWTVWLDELALTVGDSLSRHIDAALAQSRFGAVVLSPSFFEKEWPQRELAGLVAREVDSRAKIILPVWHEVDHHYIAQRSPPLADRFAATTRWDRGGSREDFGCYARRDERIRWARCDTKRTSRRGCMARDQRRHNTSVHRSPRHRPRDGALWPSRASTRTTVSSCATRRRQAGKRQARLVVLC